MTLPSSGPITMANIQSEFGGVNPISLTEYYRGGSYVAASAPTVGIPASGAIKMTDFYGKSNIPLASATLKWSGAISNGATLDASSFVTTPYSTLLVIQWYATGGEVFYYPPTTKLNGTDMPLIRSEYSNALDDGRGTSISTKSVAAGDAATITWTTTIAGTGHVYEVLGFRDMASAVHAIAVGKNLASNNAPISTSITVSVPTNGMTLLVSADSIGVLTPFEVHSTDNRTAIDINPVAGNITYTGGNRLNVAVSFDKDLA